MPVIRFAKLNDNAVIPGKRKEDAGWDIYPQLEGDEIVIQPHETKLIPTGIASVIPKGYYVQLAERSSTAKMGLKISGGVIDSGYRGQWFIALYNAGTKTVRIVKDLLMVDPTKDEVTYHYRKAIAQAILHKVPRTWVREISLTKLQKHISERGTGAFGSTMK